MARINRFEELECWQEARVLVNQIYEITKKGEFRRDFDLKSQIRRSAISSMANTAEGFHRTSNKDFMKFLDYSRSSIAETLSHSYIAYDQGYITEHELDSLKNRADTVWKKINNFISYLHNHIHNKR